MARSPENFPHEQKGEMKPQERRETSDATKRKIGQTAIGGTRKR
jgi:hypothetical protein